MTIVVFFQKPGCQTNARQREMLTRAGHTVVAKNLLTEPWTADILRGYFQTTPVASWFNRASPRVKSGEIDPWQIDEDAALALMVADPLLIRRPLIAAGDRRCAGFDREPVTSLLDARDAGVGIEDCSRQMGSALTPCRASSAD